MRKACEKKLTRLLQQPAELLLHAGLLLLQLLGPGAAAETKATVLNQHAWPNDQLLFISAEFLNDFQAVVLTCKPAPIPF